MNRAGGKASHFWLESFFWASRRTYGAGWQVPGGSSGKSTDDPINAGDFVVFSIVRNEKRALPATIHRTALAQMGLGSVPA